MRRRALEAKWLPRLQPHMNGQGLVPIHMTRPLRIGGSDFPTGETHHVYWKLAAQLLAGVFAEVAKEAQKGRGADHNESATLRAMLKSFARRVPRDS